MAVDLREFINAPEFSSKYPEAKHFIEAAQTQFALAIRNIIQETEKQSAQARESYAANQRRLTELENEVQELRSKLRRPKAEGGKPVAGLKATQTTPRIQKQIDARKRPVTATNFGKEGDSLGARLLQAANEDEDKRNRKRRR
jgi:hypothetical protein